jgi:glucosyl-3-phosphoglycerate synthase
LAESENSEKRVTLILPAKNEESTIRRNIEVARQSKYNPEIIVTDGFSVDKTAKIAEELGVEVILPKKRIFPGKGIGMVTGLKRAISDHPDIILFLDSDIRNLTVEWIDKLIDPIIEGGYDMTRGQYQRSKRDAPVTKLVARPLLRVFFPELSHFEQPLSGEVAAKTEVWTNLIDINPPDGWGIDVWFLIEASSLGYNIREIFLGFKEHKSFTRYDEDVVKLSRMSEQVALTIIKESIKFHRIDNVDNTFL